MHSCWIGAGKKLDTRNFIIRFFKINCAYKFKKFLILPKQKGFVL